jgi:transporter family-2 protein
MMLIVVMMREPVPFIAKMSNTPWWAWTGGAFGAVYIVAAVVLVPRLGAALTVSCIVLGQMLMSLIFAQTGALGVPQHATTPVRVFGIGLLILGTLLVRR